MTPLSRFANRALAWAAVATLLATPVSAAEGGGLADLLEEKGLISAEERDSVREDAASEGEAASSGAGSGSAGEKQGPTVSVGPKGLSVTSADKAFKFAFGGRMQIDAGAFIDDETSLGDGTEMRRARIKSFGTLYSDWQYKIEVNFDDDGSVPVTDGWIRYAGFKPVSITVGHQKVPFSQQSMTSSNWQVFQERALIDAFIDNKESGRRRLGGVLGSYGDHWNIHAGLFSEGLATSGTSSEDFGTAVRGVLAPIVEPDKVLTFGGAFYYRNYQSSSDLEFQHRPEAHIAGEKLVDTGVMANSDDSFLYNFDASVVCGPFHAQAEYTGAQIILDRASDPHFWGYYVQAGWFITGESRNYDVKSGKYKRPIPIREDIGAWEIAARWSSIDLQDEGIRGGKEENITAGVNWWVNQNVMFRLNYVYGMVDPNSEIAGLGGEDEDVHAFMARAQVVF